LAPIIGQSIISAPLVVMMVDDVVLLIYQLGCYFLW